jgi:hypothetical protein
MDQIFFKFHTLLCLDLEEVLSQDPRDITSFHLPFLCYQSTCLLWKLCVQCPTLGQLNFMTIVSFSDSINSLGEIDLNRNPRRWK